MNTPLSIEKRAIAFAKKYYESLGYQVEVVSHNRTHKGYDFFATRNTDSLKIEVKGSKNLWGIPDPYETEFDEHMQLVADELCMVYFVGDESPMVCVIPRAAIPPTEVTRRVGYRISGRVKNKSVLERYTVATDIRE